jgi:hypothetical protein
MNVSRIQEAEKFNTILQHTFIKHQGQWFIYHSDFLEQGWSKEDLSLTEGSARLLNLVANGAKRVTLLLSTAAFDDADCLKLVEPCRDHRCGGIYLMDSYGGRRAEEILWLCDMALFVFGDIPTTIYLKRLKKERAA